MPLVRIDLRAGKSAEHHATMGDVVYNALRAIDVPEDDRFQIITEHAPEGLIADRTYLGIDRTDDCIVVQITLNEGRTLLQKRHLYKGIVDGLHDRLDMRREDVVINLVEVSRENWSYGNGEAQYT